MIPVKYDFHNLFLNSWYAINEYGEPVLMIPLCQSQSLGVGHCRLKIVTIMVR